VDFFYITHRKAAPKEGAAEDEVRWGEDFFVQMEILDQAWEVNLAMFPDKSKQ